MFECPLCKDKRPVCVHKYKLLPKVVLSKDFFGHSYNVFVGWAGYPNVSLGPMASSEQNPILDNPSKWFGLPYEKIIEMRYLLVRARSNVNIKSGSRFVEENQLIALSEPIDVEMVFRKQPMHRWEFSNTITPTGPVADIESMKIIENPKIPKKLDDVINDEMKASEACVSIYETVHDVYKLSSILSSGALGLNKKLVPTKWSITVVDDILAKHLITELKDYSSVNEHLVYSCEYLDNHFEVLLMPGKWEFENFESWVDNGRPVIIGEYEGYMGRKGYAHIQSGGYYASRIGVAEGLANMKKQAKVVVFREIYEGYTIPMGVWVVRETVRNAMKSHCKKFPSLEEALRDINTRLRIPIRKYMEQSRIFSQKRLTEFFGKRRSSLYGT